MNHIKLRATVGFSVAMFVVSAAAHAFADEMPPPAKPKPTKPELSCTLLTVEAPAGGRLDVEASHFGTTPVVRIAGKPMRMIERTATRIAVQISADSDGGEVTLQAGKQSVVCGTLVILGKD